MKTIMSTSVLVAIFSIVAACNSDSQEDSNVISDELNIVVLHGGSYLSNGDFTSKSTKIIQSQESYELLLPTYSSDTSKVLNFSEGSVLLVDMGQRNTGGYKIEVSSAIKHNEHIQVNVLLSEPGANCAVDTALTNPYQLVWIPSIHEQLIQENIQETTCE